MKLTKKLVISLILVLFIVPMICSGCENNHGEVNSGGQGTLTEEQKKEDEIKNGKHKFTIVTMSDLHLIASSEIEDDECSSLVQYNKTRQRMLAESELLFMSAVDQVIEDKVDVVLLGGDLSECGSRTSLEVVARECARMEEAGIDVFVTCGVSDFENQGTVFTKEGSVHTEGINKRAFTELFAEYGYGSALMMDTDTLSYCVDIPNSDYRLVVIDTASNFDYSDYSEQTSVLETVDKIPKASDELLDFTESMLKKSEEDGKEPLCLSYYPICDDIGKYVGALTKELVISIDRGDEFEDILSEYGTRYIFSGHMHTQNYLEKENFFGKIANQASGSLSCYPLPINYFTRESDGSLLYTAKTIEKVNPAYFPTYLSEEKKTAMQTDLIAYARKFVYDNLEEKLQTSIDWWRGRKNGLFLRIFYISCLWNYPGVDNSIAEGMCEDLTQRFHYIMNLPLYGKEESLESICARYEVTLPKTDYTTIYDFFASQICDIYADDIHLRGGSDEAVIFRYIVYYIGIEIADLEVYDRMHQINPLIDEFDMHGVTEHLFRTGILDLTIDDALLHMLSFTNPRLQDSADMVLDFESVDAILDIVEALYPAFLAIVIGPEDYNADENTIWGVKITDYVNIKKGTINFTKFIDNILLDFLAKDILY